MRENPQTGALEAVDFGELLPMLGELDKMKIEFETVTFTPPLDSCNVGPAAWKQISEEIIARYDSADGFVILHGTDTMAYSASALSFMLEGLGKPVVFTGSQLPLGKLRTDGRENLLTAAEIAAATLPDGSPAVPEVCIFFHDKLYRGNRTTKASADAFEAFKSFNYPPLGTAAVDISFRPQLIRRPAPGTVLTPHLEMDSNMMVLSLFPGIQESTVRAMLEIPHLKGVVLRTFGSGNAPSHDWLPALLSEATSRGVVVVNVTQCTGGNVAMERYETGLHLLKAGVVSGRDITVEAALTKLMRLFGDGLSSAQVREAFPTDLAGE